MLNVSDRAELALALARATPSADLACRLVHGAAALLDLYRPPRYVAYKPGAMIKRDLPGGAHIVNVEPVADAIGDIAQVKALLQLVLDSARPDEGATLLMDVFQQPDRIEKDGVPCVAVAFDGFGSFPDRFWFGETMWLSTDELHERWTSATRGGRIDKAPNGLLLRLKGQRAAPAPTEQFAPVRETVVEAAAECARNRIEPARDLIGAALAKIDGEARAELADVKALAVDVVREQRPAFEQRGVVCETLFAAGLPPVPVMRGPLRGLFKRLIAYAVEADSPGASVTILFDYDCQRRAVVFAATYGGIQEVAGHAAFMASFRRTIEAHEGAFEIAAAKNEITLTTSLPDPVGKKLDDKIPGFDSFSGHSQKILRLLESGGPTPPPELLLEGVLEEELGRWLLPRLELPAATNVAHEIDPKNECAASPERLKKAVDQIKKGKPKRELAKPSFAAEIIHAFRTDPRRKTIIGAEKLSKTEMENLARALLKTPTDEQTLITCLQIVAKGEG